MRNLFIIIKEEKSTRRELVESSHSAERTIEILSETHPEWDIIGTEEADDLIIERIAS
jgi:hypothetical protein